MRRIVLTGSGLLGSLIMTYLLVVSSAAIMGAEAANWQATGEITFPYQIPGTDLVAENMVCYEGSFFENGSGGEMSGITGIVIRNAGQSGAECGFVTMQQGERTLRFALTQLPAGASVLVLEQSGQRYTKEGVSSCTGSVRHEYAGWDVQTYIMIRECETGCLEVTNICGFPLNELCLYYKSAYIEGSFFLGGITYEEWAGTLEPGQSVYLRPAHYCPGSSAVVRIGFQ